MPFDPATLGMQAASNVLNAGMGMLLEGHNDRRQLRQQTKLQNLQIAGNKEMTDYNMAKELEMWKNTSYGAQMEQIKKAGLNPGLLYGMGGTGGQSTGTPGGGVQGAQAPQGGQEILGMLMQQAQIENLKAQTDKTKAETKNVGKTGKNIEAQTAILLEGINTQKAQQALTNIQTELGKLEASFQSNTQNNRESIINHTLSQMIEQTKILENDREISDETKADKAKIIGEELQKILNENYQIIASTAKTWKEKDYIDKQIAAIQQQIDINTPDENMAKDGANPKAGGVMKWLYMIMKAASDLGRGLKFH